MEVSDMDLSNLRSEPGARRRAKRLGQGIGSGSGKTSGKGHKGQKCRSGGSIKPGFEGGQMPLSRRTPKRGFNNYRFAKTYQCVNLDKLSDKFKEGDTIGIVELYENKLVASKSKPVKILAEGEADFSFTIRANAFSEKAITKIEAAGGKAEVV